MRWRVSTWGVFFLTNINFVKSDCSTIIDVTVIDLFQCFCLLHFQRQLALIAKTIQDVKNLLIYFVNILQVNCVLIV